MLKKYFIIALVATVYYFSITSTIILLTSHKASGQNYPSNDYNLPTEWSKLKIVDHIDAKAEQKILIVTNRPFIENAKDNIYLPNGIAEYRKVTYLLAFFNGDEWKLSKIGNLKDGLDAVNYGNSFLLFVHGHGKSFISALNRTYKIKRRYNISMILFDWPSRNKNFNRSLARVRRCGENFYNLILELEEYKKETFVENQKLTMMCHSLGNYFISHMVVNGNNQYLNHPVFDNLILNAPAIKAKEHGEVISQIKIAERIFVASNTNDRVLRGAHLLTSGKMLGNYIMAPLAKNATYLDFTPTALKEHTYFAGYHEFEYSNPSYFNLYNDLFYGNEPNTDNLTKGQYENILLIE